MELDREKVRQRIDRQEGKIKSNDETSNESSGGVKVWLRRLDVFNK